MNNKITFAVMALVMSSSAVAETYVGVNLGWANLHDYCLDSNLCNDENLSSGAYLGYSWNDYIAAEMGYDYLGNINNQVPKSISGNVIALRLGSVLNLPITERFSVYNKIGFANIFADHSENFVATAGVGVAYKFDWNLALKAEYQYFEGIDSLANSVDVNQVSLGFHYKYGEPTPIYEDKIIRDTKVELYDKVTVGSYAEQKLTLTFKLNSAVIDNANALGSMLSLLSKHPEAKVVITGHTDITGTPRYNYQLSQLRAKAVALYLEQRGISADRMTIEGQGDTMPIANNSTFAGRKKNRRVEIVVPSFNYQTVEPASREVDIETIITEDVSPSWW